MRNASKALPEYRNKLQKPIMDMFFGKSNICKCTRQLDILYMVGKDDVASDRNSEKIQG